MVMAVVVVGVLGKVVNLSALWLHWTHKIVGLVALCWEDPGFGYVNWFKKQ